MNCKDNDDVGVDCSISSRLVSGDDSWAETEIGWATCAHCLPDCPPAEWEGNMHVDHNADGSTRWIGKVIFWDPVYDFAAIEAYDSETPASKMAYPQYPDTDAFDHSIAATLTKNGISAL